MVDALMDRSNYPESPTEMIGPKNRLLREHELVDPESLSDDETELQDEHDCEVAEITSHTVTEEDGLLEGIDYISAAKLSALTGESDLTEVTLFEASVDTESTSLSDIGNLLPRLTQLKLSNSNICSLRDLGTSLHQLRVLWLNRAGLQSLDGLGSIAETIEELYLAFNHVADLSPIADDDFTNLRILDADSNEIDDLEQVEFLAGCKNLSSLTLENNPVATMQGYVVFVRDTLPQIELLDDIEIEQDRSPAEGASATNSEEQLSEVMLIAESIKLSRLGYNDVEYLCGASAESQIPMSARPSSARPATAISRPGTSGGIRPKTPFESCICGFGTRSRPSTALARPSTSTSIRPATSMCSRPGTAIRPPTAMADVGGSSSDLTFGSNEALCGGISRALRSRKRESHEHPEKQAAEHKQEEQVSISALTGMLPGDRDGGAAAGENSVDILQINYDSSDHEEWSENDEL